MEVNEVETSKEITIKIRGEKRFVEICRVTELQDANGKTLASRKHREALDSTDAARLDVVLGADLSEKVKRLAAHGLRQGL